MAHHVDVPRGENVTHQQALGQFEQRLCIAYVRVDQACIVPKTVALLGVHSRH
ncbi:hypothetical protein [Xanthomonas vasicola]|uniref:hypothetical protein n=1 Tax=Xanthomonas vasicola TaxID=56459 RepID=UPI00030FB6A9|nr:hypothetical protein [Xanthomonas vasicola]